MTANNPVRVIEAFVDELDLATLEFEGVAPEATGRPSYHPSTLLAQPGTGAQPLSAWIDGQIRPHLAAPPFK